MNKKLVVLVIIIVIIACVALVLFGKGHNGNGNQGKPGENVVYSEIPIISTKSIKAQKDNITVDMDVPQITNIDASFCDYFNQKVVKDLNYEKIYNDESIMDDVKQDFYFETKYEAYREGDFLSIVIVQKSVYGTNREKQVKKCYVVDAKNSKTALLEDVVSEPYNYKYYIVSKINDLTSQKNIEIIGGNGLSTISDTQAFYIKDGKMHLYFTSGQISPVANGELDLEMPFKIENGRFVLTT